jgi:hypothetical protein
MPSRVQADLVDVEIRRYRHLFRLRFIFLPWLASSLLLGQCLSPFAEQCPFFFRAWSIAGSAAAAMAVEQLPALTSVRFRARIATGDPFADDAIFWNAACADYTAEIGFLQRYTSSISILCSSLAIRFFKR